MSTDFSQLGEEVAVGEIDRRLQALFADGDAGGRGGVTRASLLNLAVYSESLDTLDDSAGAIETITHSAACRAILILAPAGGEPHVRSWIRAHCNLASDGSKSVCTEQVAFLLQGADAKLVHSAVFSHLDSDLPLVFWWRGELSEAFNERLYSRIDRFIFDSESWTHPSSQFLRLHSARQEQGTGFVLHDLSYTRLHPIRSTFAAFFDPPRVRQEIPRLDRITLEYEPGHRMSALWLATWLANRLRLEFSAAGSTRDALVFDRIPNPGSLLRIRVLESAGEDTGGGIHRITMRSNDAVLEIGRLTESEFWRLKTEFQGESPREALLPASNRSDIDLVTEILVRSGRNSIMCEGLDTMRAILAV